MTQYIRKHRHTHAHVYAISQRSAKVDRNIRKRIRVDKFSHVDMVMERCGHRASCVCASLN